MIHNGYKRPEPKTMCDRTCGNVRVETDVGIRKVCAFMAVIRICWMRMIGTGWVVFIISDISVKDYKRIPPRWYWSDRKRNDWFRKEVSTRHTISSPFVSNAAYQLDDIEENKDIKRSGDQTPGAKNIRIPLIGSERELFAKQIGSS